MRKYKTKLKTPETTKVIFLDALALRGKIDPDPIGQYIMDGEHSETKEQEDQVAKIMRGLK